MISIFILVFMVLANQFPNTYTYSSGAPESVCNTMLPNHGGGIPPKTSPPPFKIYTSDHSVYQGAPLLVQIVPEPPELTFAGFMIHARNASPPHNIIGQFVRSDDGLFKLTNCDGFENTATHQSSEPKGLLGLQWQAPVDYDGKIEFIATVAQQYDMFWVGIKSDPVTILRSGSTPIKTTIGISTTRQPVRPRMPPFVQRVPPIQPFSDPIYNGCGSVKSCFGFPDGCVESQNCRAVATSIVNGDRFEFELKGYNNPKYVAVGLSTDNKMGEDSVMECVQEGGIIQAYTSWTTPRPNLGVTRDGVNQNIVRLLDSSLNDGVVYCHIERVPQSEVNGQVFDLVNNKYHLLVAAGTGADRSSVHVHDLGKIASGQPKFLADVADFIGASVLLLRLHGAFMITAWIGTASVGILLARYFKQTWVGSSICGKDQWFAWHRFFMVLTWSLTLAAFIIIFVELGAWSSEPNPHAILGTIVTVICFFQPIGALFRPAPNHKNRPIFNWTHWLGGNVAHILAIVTIFFAVKLSKAELPEWFDWILVAFVAFHVIMHLIFSIAGCASDRSSTQRVNSFPMGDMSPIRNGMKDRKVDAPYTSLRRILLTVYLIVVILFVVALILIAVLAPIEETYKTIKNNMTR